MTVVGWITLYHPSRHDARGVPLKKCIFGPPYPFIMIATRGHWELGIATLVRWDGKHHSLLMTASLLTTRLDWQWLPLFWLQDLTGNDCLCNDHLSSDYKTWLAMTASLLTTRLDWQWLPLAMTTSLLTTRLDCLSSDNKAVPTRIRQLIIHSETTLNMKENDYWFRDLKRVFPLFCFDDCVT